MTSERDETHYYGDGHNHGEQQAEPRAEPAGVPEGAAWAVSSGAAAADAIRRANIRNLDTEELGRLGEQIRLLLVAERAAATARAERAEGALAAEREQTEQVLLGIRDVAGRVCDRYEICEHVACNSAYAAFALADEALRTAAPAASGEPRCYHCGHFSASLCHAPRRRTETFGVEIGHEFTPLREGETNIKHYPEPAAPAATVPVMPTLKGLPPCGNCGHAATEPDMVSIPPGKWEGHSWYVAFGDFKGLCVTPVREPTDSDTGLCFCNEYELPTADSEFPLPASGDAHAAGTGEGADL